MAFARQHKVNVTRSHSRRVGGRSGTVPLSRSYPTLLEMLFCPLMFYGSATPRDMDFSQFVIMFKSIFYEGFGRPFDGIRLILKKLVRKFKSLGGEKKRG